MASDIFSILGIERTDNFDMVEQLYLNKLQSLEDVVAENPLIENKVYLDDLKTSWKKVDSREKLHYFFKYKHFFLKFPTPQANTTLESHKIVYIPVFITERIGLVHPDDVLQLDKLNDAGRFQEEFNYHELARVLTYKCKNKPILVGITLTEAERIYELDSASYYAVIVEVSILEHQLTMIRYAEQDIYTNSEGKAAPYFCLSQNCTFATQNIISVCPVEPCWNNQKHIPQNTVAPKWLWPRVGRTFLAITNPNAACSSVSSFSIPDNQVFLVDLSRNLHIKALKNAIASLKKLILQLNAERKEIQKYIDEIGPYYKSYPEKEDLKKETEMLRNEMRQMKRWSEELDEDLRLFIRDMSSLKLSLPAFSGALVQFKDDLNEKLSNYHAVLGKYQHYNNTQFLNLLIAFTGVGLFALLPKLAYSYYTTGKAEGFFAQPQTIKTVEYVRKCLEHLTVSNLRI